MKYKKYKKYDGQSMRVIRARHNYWNPVSKSPTARACCISALVFMTNGPCCATGSSIGRPCSNISQPQRQRSGEAGVNAWIQGIHSSVTSIATCNTNIWASA